MERYDQGCGIVAPWTPSLLGAPKYLLVFRVILSGSAGAQKWDLIWGWDTLVVSTRQVPSILVCIAGNTQAFHYDTH